MFSKQKHITLLRIVALVAALSLAYSSVAQRTVTISPGMSRAQIQDSINAAGPGGTVLAAGGTYTLTGVTWDGPALTLPAGVSIVGDGPNPVVFHLTSGARLFNIGSSTNPDDVTRIQNLTMTSATSAWADGGAILASSVSATNRVRLEMDNVNITTQVGRNGGAIWANNADITIRNSNIMGCGAQNGGALHLTNSNVNIFDSRIGNNGAATGGGTQQGGAIWVTGGELFIQRTQIFGNSTSGVGQGGAVFLNGNATVTLDHCDVTNNSAVGGGSSFFLANSNNTLTLSFTTVTGNNNVGWAPGGGGITGGNNTNTVNIINSIVSGNTNPGGGPGGGDPNVNPDAPNINVEGSVVDTNFIVSNDPNHECLDVPCEASVPDGYIRCVYCGIFSPDSIVVGDSGTTTAPPVVFPDGDSTVVGSGGGYNTVLVLTVTRIVCPADVIRITVSQTNMQNTQLRRVDRDGNLISVVGPVTAATQFFEITPIPDVPVMWFQARGRCQDGDNPWHYTDIQEALILPFVISEPIDHSPNLPPIPPLPPTNPNN
ncbi:MAG: hypothetical protein FWC98_02495 [Bacteroidales bacterium]|nr:hypothetical protein [Bacteroidales bacterium]